MISGFRYLVDELPVETDVPPLSEIPAGAYYEPLTGYSDTLTVPVELGALFDRFMGLDGDNRERFLRACFWYHTASTGVGLLTISLAYLFDQRD
jgi:hypothetical protein